MRFCIYYFIIIKIKYIWKCLRHKPSKNKLNKIIGFFYYKKGVNKSRILKYPFKRRCYPVKTCYCNQILIYINYLYNISFKRLLLYEKFHLGQNIEECIILTYRTSFNVIIHIYPLFPIRISTHFNESFWISHQSRSSTTITT